MEPVKTYQNVNREDESMSFGISRMEEIHDRYKGIPDQPHRHNYFTILLVKNASGEHRIDFNSYPLGKMQLFFISPGQVHQMIEASRSVGYAMVFSTQFLALNNIPLSFINDLNLFNDFGDTPPLSMSSDELETLSRYAEEIMEINESNRSFKYEAIGSLIKLLLIRCHNLCSLKSVDSNIQETGNSVLRNFKSLVELHHKQWHGTTEYANELNISPDHLNRVVKSLTGKTAKEHIQSRIITAAKRLIHFTDLSSKEIGYELGFSEPGNFSAFFKKCTGFSPSKFKTISK